MSFHGIRINMGKLLLKKFMNNYSLQRQRSTQYLLMNNHQEIWTHPFAEAFSTTPSINSIIKSEPNQNESLDSIQKSVQELMGLRTHKTSGITVEKKVRNFCDLYLELASESNEVKCSFLEGLAQNYDINKDEVKSIASQYIENPETEKFSRLEETLRSSLIPPYIWLFQKIAQLNGGVKFLVDLRSDLITLSPSNTRFLNSQLKTLLGHWFAVGFLELQQVTWGSSCAMLQKISDYEAVHPIRNWTDLKSRVGEYRRCFVYTHRSMPEEPIVVLHVALSADSVPGDISQVVKHYRKIRKFASMDVSFSSTHRSKLDIGYEDPDLCNVATFYSITSTQKGLKGIELGTQLIKQAVISLSEEFPKMKTFSTLSPIPGFKSWLLSTLHSVNRKEIPLEALFTESEISALELTNKLPDLISLIKADKWVDTEELQYLLELPFMRLCSRYLYIEKHRQNALDSVANFHLRNGATLWRLNWKGDTSIRGLSNSCGMMVNYRYFMDKLEINSTTYQETHLIDIGDQVHQLSTQAKSLMNEK
ncbi:malonyl-CoA decarboxylase, mitochondrial [Lepeophtheirus salmonis]|uniref:malonyl-CoA decarboxylase, mitochondrial n=1 Tax=Lepeophtheirus salmonis TaxID=72036 RepID=UPI001AE29366|nr:malonyl-CoA decarboxylase, mitochondrial-like [Lepeophtheirus salmonis]